MDNNNVDLMAWPEDNKPNKGLNKVLLIIITLVLVAAIVVLLILNPFKKKDTNGDNKGNNNVKIVFISNGGTEIKDYEIESGSTVMLPIPTKEGYIFAGWYLEDETTEVTGSYNFTKETKLYAKWNEITPDIKTVTISFNSNGGTSVNSITLQCENDEATITGFPANPIKTNYVFDSWKDDKGNIVAVNSKVSCNNTTLNANWVKKEESTTTTTTTTKGNTTTTTRTRRGKLNTLTREQQIELMQEANCGKTLIADDGSIAVSRCITLDTKCDEPYKAYGPYCYLMDNKIHGEPTCLSKVIEDAQKPNEIAHTYEGVYAEADGQGKCLYGLNTSLRTYSQCTKVDGMKWVKTDEGYKCVLQEVNDYVLICALDGYTYLTPDVVKEITGTKPTIRYCYKFKKPNA